MRLDSFIAGLDILSKHFKDPHGFHIGAEHDQFYIYATDTALTPDEYQRMKALGWFQTGDDGAPYDVEEGWSAFT